MTELKTLKDIFFPEDKQIWKAREEYEMFTELKAEAVRWVKSFDGLGIGIFMEFFNLTEEDLK